MHIYYLKFMMLFLHGSDWLLTSLFTSLHQVCLVIYDGSVLQLNKHGGKILNRLTFILHKNKEQQKHVYPKPYTHPQSK